MSGSMKVDRDSNFQTDALPYGGPFQYLHIIKPQACCDNSGSLVPIRPVNQFLTDIVWAIALAVAGTEVPCSSEAGVQGVDNQDTGDAADDGQFLGGSQAEAPGRKEERD